MPSATAKKIAICGGQSQRCVSSASTPPRKGSAMSVTTNNSRCSRRGACDAAAPERSVRTQCKAAPAAKAMIWLDGSDVPAPISAQKTPTSTSGATAFAMGRNNGSPAVTALRQRGQGGCRKGGSNRFLRQGLERRRSGFLGRDRQHHAQSRNLIVERERAAMQFCHGLHEAQSETYPG